MPFVVFQRRMLRQLRPVERPQAELLHQLLPLMRAGVAADEEHLLAGYIGEYFRPSGPDPACGAAPVDVTRTAQALPKER